MPPKKRLISLPEKAHFFLLGPRQVGKSTLIKTSFKPETVCYFNLLIDKEYTRLAANPSIFSAEVEALAPSVTHIVVDEIQRIPSLLNEVHNLIENAKTPRFFCLSGSSARKLKRGQANLLGGRAWNRHLYPFTHLELAEDFNLARALRFGALPAVYLGDDENAIEMLEAYVDTYLTEEIKAEAIVRNIGAFARFFKLAASESGNLINSSNIAREAAISSKTIKEYFQILEDTLIGYFLLPYDKSDRKRLVKHPKFYLFDNGVRNALLNRLKSDVEPNTYEYGVVFEHFIINEFIRLNHYLKLKLEFSFYRSNAGAEVDLIVHHPCGRVQAIEIKSTENPRPSELMGLKSFAELEPEAELICLSRCHRRQNYGAVTVYPWQEFFAQWIAALRS